jgi:hypothetical protein
MARFTVLALVLVTAWTTPAGARCRNSVMENRSAGSLRSSAGGQRPNVATWRSIAADWSTIGGVALSFLDLP